MWVSDEQQRDSSIRVHIMYQAFHCFLLGYSWLTDNVVIVSGEQRRDSAIHIHVCIKPSIVFICQDCLRLFCPKLVFFFFLSFSSLSCFSSDSRCLNKTRSYKPNKPHFISGSGARNLIQNRMWTILLLLQADAAGAYPHAR